MFIFRYHNHFIANYFLEPTCFISLSQTTNNVFDKTLYEKVKPQSLLAWQRVRLANHLATNGSHWFDVVKQFNSGTYNNQYMVLDLRKIRVGEYIEDDALWVVEQIPGLVLGKGEFSFCLFFCWAGCL